MLGLAPPLASPASVAENLGSGHTRPAPILLLRACGWAPKIAPVNPLITVQRFHHRPLIVQGTWAEIPPLGKSFFFWRLLYLHREIQRATPGRCSHLVPIHKLPGKLGLHPHGVENESQAQRGELTDLRPPVPA